MLALTRRITVQNEDVIGVVGTEVQNQPMQGTALPLAPPDGRRPMMGTLAQKKMNNSRPHIEGIAKPILKKAGYKKKRLTWHKDHDELILVFNIQSSQWSDRYYLNLGIYLKKIGNESKPPEYRCHVRRRLESLIPDAKLKLEFNKSTDYEEDIPLEDREKTLKKSIIDCGMPWLDTMTQFKEFVDHVNSNSDLFVHKEVRELIKNRG